MLEKYERIYPACRTFVDGNSWKKLVETCASDDEPDSFPDQLESKQTEFALPAYLPDLARLELAVNKASTEESVIALKDRIEVNPSLRLLRLRWKNLSRLLRCRGEHAPEPPKSAEEFVLVWRSPETGSVRTNPASHEDLLVLKAVVEGIDPVTIARTGDIPVGAVDLAIDRAVRKGILLEPSSEIRRDADIIPAARGFDDSFLVAQTFALQWHVTQACDLHCKHCYDRSKRSPLRVEQGLSLLDDLRSFCQKKHVRGHVTFTGGNPLLYPHFLELYRGASERGFSIAVLGNPTPREQVEALLKIEEPGFFQVSLEGLEEHNDVIRGPGHFKRTMKFLEVLRELDIYSMVMLTLTSDNIDQVLPLAELLRGRTDQFNFNRLSMVGEGASLKLPARDQFEAFLEKYLDASRYNPVMFLKDNLMNIVRRRRGLPVFGGCTGYGCGAAFNFIAVLPDGEAHACRKFPSPIGNVYAQSLEQIYDSDEARRYREGCSACSKCDIRPVCGGCLASTFSHGLNIFEDRDPYCFREPS